MEKCIIVAISDNNAIGRDNALLWHLSEDLKFFRRTTLGCPVIMGRKTYESIGRPLPKRVNIVVTRGSEAPEGTLLAHSLDEAFALAAVAEEGQEPARSFVIGGGQIYSQALTLVDRLIVTHVHTVIEGADTFFPEIDPTIWQCTNEERHEADEKHDYAFTFATYIRQ